MARNVSFGALKLEEQDSRKVKENAKITSPSLSSVPFSAIPSIKEALPHLERIGVFQLVSYSK
ncbi:hypothetical protein ACTXT7_017277 [Hymenolepis weldensis]